MLGSWVDSRVGSRVPFVLAVEFAIEEAAGVPVELAVALAVK